MEGGGGALAKSPVHESFQRAAGVTVQGTNQGYVLFVLNLKHRKLHFENSASPEGVFKRRGYLKRIAR